MEEAKLDRHEKEKETPEEGRHRINICVVKEETEKGGKRRERRRKGEQERKGRNKGDDKGEGEYRKARRERRNK